MTNQMPETVQSSLEKQLSTKMEIKASKFFPGPETFADLAQVTVDQLRGPRKVLISLDVLRTLIGLAATCIAFDESYYVDRNPDLKKAAEAGQIADLKEHFAAHGYFENRSSNADQANPVDEAWYLSEYPDVKQAILTGDVASARAHYLSTGRKEGRLPRPNVSNIVSVLLNDIGR